MTKQNENRKTLIEFPWHTKWINERSFLRWQDFNHCLLLIMYCDRISPHHFFNSQLRVLSPHGIRQAVLFFSKISPGDYSEASKVNRNSSNYCCFIATAFIYLHYIYNVYVSDIGHYSLINIENLDNISPAL